MWNYRRIALLTGACISVVAGSAVAQTASTAKADSEMDLLEEIIVTAQRRDESLSKTPVAVAVLSSDMLAKAQITTEQDLRSATPGLTVRATLNSNQLNYSLRGQSQDAYSGTRPGVLPYINEVQIGGAGSGTAFYDLQTVQVLKGPQGTLFGRSATGGAVLFTTAKPTEELSGYVSALGGNHGAMKAEAAVSGPIAGDALLGRIAGVYQKRDGFQYNLYDGGREGDLDRYAARASLSAKFGDRVRNDLMVDYFHTDDESMLGLTAGLMPLTTPGQPPFIPIELLYAGTATPLATATGIGTLQAFTGASSAAATAFYNAYFADPRHPAIGVRGLFNEQQARGPFVVNTDGSNFSRVKNIVVTNTTTFDVADATKIKNIIGYARLKSLNAVESDSTPYSIAEDGYKGTTTAIEQITKQWSEELQLQSQAFDARLSYVAGIYVADENAPYRQYSQFFDLLFGGQTQQSDFEISTRTYAGYAQGTYDLNDAGLAVTAGARYTSEKISKSVYPPDVYRIALTAAFGEAAPPGYNYDQATTYNKVSWQFGLQDQLNDQVLLYATTRRAFKSGGYNGTVAPKVGYADTAGDGYRAERVTDVELGAKFEGRLGDMPARLNTALYHNWITDSQRTAYTLVLGNPGSLTVNVPSGRTYGAEMEGLIVPTRGLTLGGSINYTHATYGSDAIFVNGSTQSFDQVPDTAKYSGTLFADVTIPVTARLAITLHGDVYGQDKTFTSPRSQNSDGTVIASYTLANFRVGIEDTDKGWSVTANLKNAFDKVYDVGGIPTGEIYQINNLVPGDPRTVTVEARLKF